MEPCLRLKRSPSQARLEPGTARSVDQRYRATGANNTCIYDSSSSSGNNNNNEKKKKEEEGGTTTTKVITSSQCFNATVKHLKFGTPKIYHNCPIMKLFGLTSCNVFEIYANEMQTV